MRMRECIGYNFFVRHFLRESNLQEQLLNNFVLVLFFLSKNTNDAGTRISTELITVVWNLSYRPIMPELSEHLNSAFNFQKSNRSSSSWSYSSIINPLQTFPNRMRHHTNFMESSSTNHHTSIILFDQSCSFFPKIISKRTKGLQEKTTRAQFKRMYSFPNGFVPGELGCSRSTERTGHFEQAFAPVSSAIIISWVQDTAST